MKKFLLALALAFCSCPLFSFVNESTLDAEVGGRWDQVRFDFAATGLNASYHFDNLASYQIGLRGNWALSSLWYLRGNVDYAVITSGDAKINSVESSYLLQTGSAKGHMLDMEAALGRFFCLTRSIAIAPVIGWSYDGQYVWTKGMGSKYAFKEFVSGALVGVDLHTEWLCHSLSVDLGYELHFVSSRAKVQYQPVTGLSDIRGHAKVTYGELAWLEATWRFCCNWRAGLRGEVMSYSTTKPGTVTPKSQAPTYGQAHSQEMSWRSAQVMAVIDYIF